MAMRAGNFDPNNPENLAFCSKITGWAPQCGGVSNINIRGNYGNNVVIANNNIASYIDPGGAAIMKEIVQPNFVPTANNPYNFIQGVMSSDNGYMFHSRVDYNFSESTKLYVSYNQQRDDSGIPVMLWWLPPNSQTFPGWLHRRWRLENHFR